MALALAEQHGNAELYREASRFVLDQRKRNALSCIILHYYSHAYLVLKSSNVG